jgi:putative peptidoglycan lipid II flippase
VTFTALSLLPKVFVVAKDVTVAFYFGTGQALDVYLMAFVLIGMPVSIIVVALQTTLISALVGKPIETAASLLGGALKIAVIGLMLALPVWLLLLPFVLNTLYPDAVEATRTSLLQACYWLIPYYFLNGINLIMYGALQAKKIFWVNAVLPIVFPIAIIAALALTRVADIRSLLMGTVIGSLLECSVLFAILNRSNFIQWRKTAGSGLRSVFVSALPLMIGSTAGSLTPVIEQVIAFKLGPGAVSLLSYGNKVPLALSTLLVTSIGIVILPHFADLVAERQWRESRTLHWRISGILIALGVLVAVIGSVYAEEIVRLLFQRGAFNTGDSQLTSEVMKVYLLQLPFLLAGMISTRALAAIGKTITLAGVAFLQLLIGSVLAYYFSVKFGVVGVPMGAAVATLVGMSLLGYSVWREFTLKLNKQTQ